MFIQRSESIEIRGLVKVKIVFHGCRHYCKLSHIAIERFLVIFKIQVVFACAVVLELDVASPVIDFVSIGNQALIAVVPHGMLGCHHRSIGVIGVVDVPVAAIPPLVHLNAANLMTIVTNLPLGIVEPTGLGDSPFRFQVRHASIEACERHRHCDRVPEPMLFVSGIRHLGR